MNLLRHMFLTLLLLSIIQSSSYLLAEMPPSAKLFDWTKREEGKDISNWLKENDHALSYCDACNLEVYWNDEESKIGLGPFSLISFLADPHDEEEIGTTVHHLESGMNVSIGVRYLPIEGKLSIIQIALALNDSPKDVFNEVDRSEAEMAWRKSDMFIRASKCVKIGNLIFTFRLSCQSGKTYLRFLRRRK